MIGNSDFFLKPGPSSDTGATKKPSENRSDATSTDAENGDPRAVPSQTSKSPETASFAEVVEASGLTAKTDLAEPTAQPPQQLNVDLALEKQASELVTAIPKEPVDVQLPKAVVVSPTIPAASSPLADEAMETPAVGSATDAALPTIDAETPDKVSIAEEQVPAPVSPVIKSDKVPGQIVVDTKATEASVKVADSNKQPQVATLNIGAIPSLPNTGSNPSIDVVSQQTALPLTSLPLTSEAAAAPQQNTPKSAAIGTPAVAPETVKIQAQSVVSTETAPSVSVETPKAEPIAPPSPTKTTVEGAPPVSQGVAFAADSAANELRGDLVTASREVPSLAREQAVATQTINSNSDRAMTQAQVITRQISIAFVPNESGALEVRLDPPELGRVKMQIVVGDDRVTAAVSAERPDVMDLLRRNAELLQRELQNAGHKNVEINFGETGLEKDGQHGFSAEQTESADDATGDPTNLGTASPHSYRNLPAGRHLDIRI